MLQDLFQSQPTWVILLSFGAGPVFLMLALNFMFYKIFKNTELTEDDRSFLSTTLGGLITLACITIGFAYSIAITNSNQADSDLFSESSRIVNLDRLLTVDSSKQAIEAKKVLSLYATSIVTDEWPEMIKGGHSVRTTALLRQLQESLNSIDPITEKQQTIFGQIITESQEVQASRTQRILNTAMTIPPLFIKLTNLLIILILVLSSVLMIKVSKIQKFALLLQGCIFSIFVAGIMLLDAPYTGAMPVTPDAILKALNDTL
jgi:hypothetical protein